MHLLEGSSTWRTPKTCFAKPFPREERRQRMRLCPTRSAPCLLPARVIFARFATASSSLKGRNSRIAKDPVTVTGSERAGCGSDVLGSALQAHCPPCPMDGHSVDNFTTVVTKDGHEGGLPQQDEPRGSSSMHTRLQAPRGLAYGYGNASLLRSLIPT